MPVLRTVLFAIGVLLLIAAAIAFLGGAEPPFVLSAATLGALLTLGVLFERVTYKRLVSGSPGPGFVPTPERFVDPASGRLVQVYTRPETGERAYVEVGTAPKSGDPAHLGESRR
jgi:hypothetical protein